MKIKLIHYVMHEWAHIKGKIGTLCAHSCVTQWTNFTFTYNLVRKCWNNPVKSLCSKHFWQKVWPFWKGELTFLPCMRIMHAFVIYTAKKVSPPFQNGQTFCQKRFEQNDLAGLFQHFLPKLCVKIKLVHWVTHEWAHKVPIFCLTCAYSCMT